ncbi:MAG: SDR family oxidoreductase [Bacteroidota bacterium]
MQTVSILGCGWLGLPLGKFLVEKGFKVKGSTTSLDKLSTLSAAGIESFHLAAKPHTIEGKNIAEFFESDLLILNIPPGRRNEHVEKDHPAQIQTIIKYTKAEHILFISSTGVYGDTNAIAKEGDELAPTRKSTKALVKVEQYLQSLEDKKVTILRMSGLVGGDRKAGRFFAGKQGVSDPEKPVNMVHREDCIRVIHQVIVQEKWGEIYNVCADEHPSKKAFYIAQTGQLGLELPIFTESTRKDSYKIVSNEKVKRELNYQFLHPDPMRF